ncbi:Glutamate synthase (ferredoxin) [Geodermatophilus obscurus DSM 43160]|uniref:Glutamate synthase (Ferredoxin) n=1 Tax=Geodermatophilus obscurus (strain ATCC 25078 / DSM 43160 / JCM 3152 / CCUG 61914 / KCC A-0152 / KCTC 9177 / NBRC 13315 / NRRL B-3577 / G-20) TaxID=526225 RepID=D2SA03_GEOOG|nr:Glutamate synthase (ferredoxin) [Geodermatophilus obscurus DSM 43160]
MPFSAVPAASGLYDPANDKDACGVAFVADVQGRASRKIVAAGLTALHNLDHRGAAGSEPNSGDGAGILTQVPDALLRAEVDFDLPPVGEYAVGIAFLPVDEAERAARVDDVVRLAAEEGLTVLGWRELPVDPDGADVGPTARAVMPHFAQLFVAETIGARADGTAFGGGTAVNGVTRLERRAFVLRKRAERAASEAGSSLYITSLSSRTITYKGMLTTDQLPAFFPDLRDERYASAIALVHSRFSTNTFPSWPLAHPFRLIAHNGEINTIKGNRNRMRAREAKLETALFDAPGGGSGGDGAELGLERIFPVTASDFSDSATFDEVLELLHLSGRSLPHAVLMMIPEAWENHDEMDPARRAFYRFHASIMEPWDGPAAVAFTDGTLIGAVLDRNGLRPGRWWHTKDDLVVLASEVGVLEIPDSDVVAKGRLQPGRMFLVDTAAGKIVSDEEVKGALAGEHPYEDWLHAGLVHLPQLPERRRARPSHESVVRRQQLFGYTEEDLRVLLTPMASSGAEPIGSMGTDTPVAALSDRSRLLYDYFGQLFAQVTNPPLDAIREELVTSLGRTFGPEQNLLRATPASCRQLFLPYPVIDNDELAKILHIDDDGDLPGYAAVRITGHYDVNGGGTALAQAVEQLRTKVSRAIAAGARIIVLSDRDCDENRAPIPSLLMTAAVHHHLVRQKTRMEVGLVVESGDCREVHHVALLLGYGAAAVNPYLAFESIEDLIRDGNLTGIQSAQAVRNVVKALGKGVLKVMSKMGISTVGSYTMAQIFEAVGLSQEIVDEYFTGTSCPLGGVGIDVLAEEVAMRHRRAYPENPTERAHRRLETGGEYQWRREGEVHLFNPETVFLLQHATRARQYDVFQRYTETVDKLSEEAATLRGLFTLRTGVRPPVPIDEVEPVSEIVRRFQTGAMSYGSISQEAHETLAIAMNRLGGKSNTGEGGEDPDRFQPDPNGDLRRSAIKQVASGRFGVTSEYLVNADDIQIKMAQGAKPGEGGQLPGAKVYPWVARTRHSTPGVGLISPPPHHDIYSIEDLKQLIHDLKNANNEARVHVKLVSEVGVGTVAAGVSKAHADVVLISGHDGGTGAAPLTSLKHAGSPWELGLAETQQTLLANGLRDRIVVQADGQMKTGRDVVIAALLGAEEYGFATAPLVVSGCVMMRVCHLDTCPVGVATQNPELRKRFTGRPEFVVTFFEFLAEQVRQYLAELGFRSLDEAIGHAELLDTRKAVDHWKAAGLDLSRMLAVPELPDGTARHRVREQDHGLDVALDQTLIQLCEGALLDARPVSLELPVRNVNRTVGTMLGSMVTRRFGGDGLPDGTIDLTFTGSAGQSFGAFVPRGITMRLFGDANDYVGKGLSGGRIVVRPAREAGFAAEDNVIAGNVIGYGATAGEVFLRGRVGERFCVRNSGALAVVEGVGDHALEYMTGGSAVILGPTGRNIAAGMSGGIGYVLDLARHRVNAEMVDVEPLDGESAQWLRDVLVRYAADTESPVAAALLADWGRWSERFSVIMPRDYRRALEARRAAEAAGTDVDRAVMEAARG